MGKVGVRPERKLISQIGMSILVQLSCPSYRLHEACGRLVGIETVQWTPVAVVGIRSLVEGQGEHSQEGLG